MKDINTLDIEAPIRAAVIDVFDTMASMDVEFSGTGVDTGSKRSRIVGSVNIAGEVMGIVSIDVKKAFARIVASEILGMEFEEIEDDDEVKDVIAEVINMVGGNLKSVLNDEGFFCELSTPSITSGNNFKIEALNMSRYQRFAFQYQEEMICVDVGLKEGEKQTKRNEASGGSVGDKDSGGKASEDDLRALETKALVDDAVIDVFDTMMALELEIRDTDATNFEGSRIVGSVGFTGDVVGVISIQVKDTFSSTMAAAMLGMEPEEIEDDDEVKDVIAEVINIIGGTVKSSLNDSGLFCYLTTPSITTGDDFKIEPLNMSRHERYSYEYQGDSVLVELGLKIIDSTEIPNNDESNAGDGIDEAQDDVNEAGKASESRELSADEIAAMVKKESETPADVEEEGVAEIVAEEEDQEGEIPDEEKKDEDAVGDEEEKDSDGIDEAQDDVDEAGKASESRELSADEIAAMEEENEPSEGEEVEGESETGNEEEEPLEEQGGEIEESLEKESKSPETSDDEERADAVNEDEEQEQGEVSSEEEGEKSEDVDKDTEGEVVPKKEGVYQRQKKKKKKRIGRLLKGIVATAVVLALFGGFWLHGLLENKRPSEKEPPFQDDTKSEVVSKSEMVEVGEFVAIEEILLIIQGFRSDLVRRQQDIIELKQNYISGIEKVEDEILKELGLGEVKSLDQALKNKKIELALLTIQRRKGLIKKLDQPLESLYLRSEKLLYLKRRIEIDGLLAPIVSREAMNDFSKRSRGLLQEQFRGSDDISVNMDDLEYPSLNRIWNEIKKRKGNRQGVRDTLSNIQGINSKIWDEICSGIYARKHRLTQLSSRAAECLSKWKGKDLVLSGLTELSPEVARYLSKWKGDWLILNGLRRLSPEAAKYLSQWKGGKLSLNGLVELSSEGAKWLSKWEGQHLELIGLKHAVQIDGAGKRIYTRNTIVK